MTDAQSQILEEGNLLEIHQPGKTKQTCQEIFDSLHLFHSSSCMIEIAT